MGLRDLADWFIPAASAHERWFVQDDPAAILPPEFVLGGAPMTNALIVVGVACVVGLVADMFYERSRLYAKVEAKLRPYRDFAPGILAVFTAIYLIWCAMSGVVLATNFPAPAGLAGLLIRLVEAGVGAMFLFGFGTATAAIGLMLLYAATLPLYGVVPALDYLYLAGIAMFLLFFARGRYSLDWFYGKPLISSPEGRKHAYLVMRLFVGAGFLALALVKWLHPGLHLALMDKFPLFNPYVLSQWVGFTWTRETYVLALAVVETIVGIWILFGFLTRVAALFLMPIFLGSIVFLGSKELVGHLPILGVLIVLFVYGDTYHKHALDMKEPSAATKKAK